MAVAPAEVIHTGPAIEQVAVKLLGTCARELQATAAKLGDKLRAVAATRHAVEFFARNWANPSGLNNSQVTRIVGAYKCRR